MLKFARFYHLHWVALTGALARIGRLSLPGKPVLSIANLGGLHDYPELGSKYKGCHVKTLVFWVALQAQRFADENQDDSWHLLVTCGGIRTDAD